MIGGQLLWVAIELGCWFSVGPVMLASEKGRKLVAEMPRDRILTETDGPFATLGGQPAFPWDVDQAVGALAEVWATDKGSVERMINENLKRALDIEPCTMIVAARYKAEMNFVDVVPRIAE
jgi:Tat protein secretion system quality control protein TatD with DNase activity